MEHAASRRDRTRARSPSRFEVTVWDSMNRDSANTDNEPPSDLVQGMSACVVLEEATSAEPPPAESAIASPSAAQVGGGEVESDLIPAQVLLLSGATREEILGALRDLHRLTAEKPMEREDVLRFLRHSRAETAPTCCRLALVWPGRDKLALRLEKARELLHNDKAAVAMDSIEMYYAEQVGGGSTSSEVAVLFPGQGSQYPDMLKDLYDHFPLVRSTFREANQVVEPFLSASLDALMFSSSQAPEARIQTEQRLMRSDVVQPVLFTADVALFRVLEAHGLEPTFVAGHSLGEYAALVAGGCLSFSDALRAVCVRGRESHALSGREGDAGGMAVVDASADAVRPLLASCQGYVAIANLNSKNQTVVAGSSDGITAVLQQFTAAGLESRRLPIAGAFHSRLAGAIRNEMAKVLATLEVQAPSRRILSSIDGRYYQGGAELKRHVVANLLEQLERPVDFLRMVERLYQDGAHTFVEVGPKKALTSFVSNILGERPHTALYSNHPRIPGVSQINRLFAQLMARGWRSQNTSGISPLSLLDVEHGRTREGMRDKTMIELASQNDSNSGSASKPFAEPVFSGLPESGVIQGASSAWCAEPIVATGVAVGLPGRMYKMFSDGGLERLMAGQNLIETISEVVQDRIVEKRVVRLVKSPDGEASLHEISDRAGVLKLAGLPGQFDLARDYGVQEDWLTSADLTYQIAVAAGLEALRDAGIPLEQGYRISQKGKRLPTRYVLPEPLQDETAIVFASCYAGLGSAIQEVRRFESHRHRGQSLEDLRATYLARLEAAEDAQAKSAADRWFLEAGQRLRRESIDQEYHFNRGFVPSYLCMGNALLAQLILARGPNLSVNAACASSTAAVATAEDLLRCGRARRVIVLAADTSTSDALLDWIGTGFLAAGAASTEADVAEAALPFDRRRHGLILGMGASAIVLETASAARARGMRGLAELLGTWQANGAYDRVRLNPEHTARELDRFLAAMERRHGLDRHALAAHTFFMSHETFTPRQGGSAQAEVHGLRRAFGESWRNVTVTNIKGMIGHAQGAGIEDAVALKALHTGVVPPVVNHREEDPEFEGLRLSRGGLGNHTYALRFAAGFGSQLAMFLARSLGRESTRLENPDQYQQWLAEVSGFRSPRLEVSGRVLRVLDGQAEPGPRPPVPIHGGPSQTERASRTSAASFAPVLSASTHASAPTARSRPAVSTDEAQAIDFPPPRPTPPPGAALGQKDIEDVVLEVLQALTGYDRQTLDLDLDLELDLGIDTLKQAQVAGRLRHQFALERESGFRIKAHPTGRHLVRYLMQRLRGDSGGTLGIPSTSPRPEQTGPVSSPVTIERPQRRVLELEPLPALPLASPAGLLTSGTVLVTDDERGVAPLLCRRLEARGVRAVLLTANGQEPGALVCRAERVDEVRQTISSARAAHGPVRGLVHLMPLAPAVTDSACAKGAGSADATARWRATLARKVEGTFHLMQSLAEDLEAADEPPAFLLVATGLGGTCGVPLLEGGSALDPESSRGDPDGNGCLRSAEGAVAGLIRSVAKELRRARVKRVDVAPPETPAEAADLTERLAQELEAGWDQTEVGLRDGRRYKPVVKLERLARSGVPALSLDENSVVLLSGGGQGITAEFAKFLARRFRPRLILLGRHPRGKVFSASTADGSQVCQGRLSTRSTSDPRERARAEMLNRNIAAMEQAGAHVDYRVCDVRDGQAVWELLTSVQATYGRLDGVVHGAGIAEDSLLSAKSSESFNRVLGVKADGVFHLAYHLGALEPAFFVAFGSVVGCLGNRGQADYAAGNALLCTFTQWLRSRLPRCRCLTLGWGMWDETGLGVETGMATLLKERGFGLITPAEGCEALWEELLYGSGQQDVLFTGNTDWLDPETSVLKTGRIGSCRVL